jgi:hypothetical protein
MLRGPLPTNIKAVIHRLSGKRIDRAELTPFVLEFALNNRDDFNLVYLGDAVEPASVQVLPVALKPAIPAFSEAELKRLTKGALLDLCVGLGISIEGDPTNLDLVSRILSERGA